jgi:hypothetical protein
MNDTEQGQSAQTQEQQNIIEKLHSETALMHWIDLQKFFAQGRVLFLDKSLDLVATAVLFANDMVNQLESHIKSELIMPPTNDHARTWYAENTELWTVVVAPYILVQEHKV